MASTASLALVLGLAAFYCAAALQASPAVDPPSEQNAGPTGDAGAQGAGDACADGLVKDDGVSEISYGWVPSVTEGIYVQVFEQRELTKPGLDEVCICWRRAADDDTIDFEVVAYADVDGQPEEQPFAAYPARLEHVPESRQGKFAQVATPGLRLPSRGGPFYVGVRWNPSIDERFFLCADESETTEAVNVWFRDDRAGGWDNSFETRDPIFENLRSLMIRPVGATGTITDVPGPGGLGLALLAAALLAAGVAALRR